MKSADNHTKRKAPVEAFFYRELMSHGRITIPPQGSFLAGQEYTQPWHTDYDMHVCRHRDDKDTMASLMRTYKWRKKMFECTLPLLSQHTLLPLSAGAEKRVSLRSHSASLSSPPVSPSHSSVTLLSVRLSAGVILCSPLALAENISMWSWTHLSEPDGCPSNCHSPLPPLIRSRLNTKKDNGR